HVASVLVDGFGLTFDQALPIFQDWNRDKAQPPESNEQVRHKLNSVFKKHPVPSLKLLNGDRANRTGNGTPTGTAAPSAASRGGDSEEWVLVTSRASEYRPEPVEFLDGGMLPKKLITIAGLGGAVKGMFWANVVADLTRGLPQGLRITIAILGHMGSFVSRANPDFCPTVLRLFDSVVTNTANGYSRYII